MKIEYFPKVAIQKNRNNSNNHFDYTPFYFTTENHWKIDKNYYLHLPDKGQLLLHLNFKHILIENLEYPHKIQVYDNDELMFGSVEQILEPTQVTEFWLLYKLFLYHFREEAWIPTHLLQWPNEKILVKIPKSEVVLLKEAIINDSTVYSIRDNLCFIKELKHIFDGKTPYFIKLSCGSVKHDDELKPVYTVYDLIKILCTGTRFLKEYNNNKEYTWWDTYIVITKWLNIEEKDEYRIIIKDRYIRGICHSKWWEFYPKTLQEKEQIYEACLELINNLQGYPDGVLDVFCENKNSGYKAWLIEINCYGPGLAAGSGLFHWIRDYKSLCQEPFEETVWKCVT